jgi:hypothetical protein
MIKPFLKKALSTVAPETAVAVSSARARSHAQKLFKAWGLFEIDQKLLQEVGSRVLSGPFRDMVLTPMTYQEHIGPFLLGTYELELHPWWDKLFQQSFDQIIDVGAKFGYYAVGLARQFPESETIAFDTDWWARKAVHEMIAANQVDRASVQGFCSPRWLQKHLRDRALIISDCEGYEGELLCSLAIPALATATLVIELHEELSPGVSARIRSHFAKTHAVSSVSARPSTPLPDLHLASLSQTELQRTSSEIRSQQEWLLLTPLRPIPQTP